MCPAFFCIKGFYIVTPKLECCIFVVVVVDDDATVVAAVTADDTCTTREPYSTVEMNNEFKTNMHCLVFLLMPLFGKQHHKSFLDITQSESILNKKYYNIMRGVGFEPTNP
jgi:hypothetical protein